jgi:TfoX/Sxy family transcriptional regulator of competence genes
MSAIKQVAHYVRIVSQERVRMEKSGAVYASQGREGRQIEVVREESALMEVLSEGSTGERAGFARSVPR